MEPSQDSMLGRRIRALKLDKDHDEYDEERPIPIGSLGTIWRLNHADGKGERHYDIAWDSGAWTVYSEREIEKDLELIEG
jgi:hypothetical protein